MSSNKLLITGANGLLGQKVVKRLLKANATFLATSKGPNRNADCPDEYYSSLDITKQEEVNELINQYAPTHIIHTAAMTNVDECELNPMECHEVNVKATEYLWEAAKNAGAHFQLLSTDFVFDGTKGNYKEEDEPNPLSIYARSKVAAENCLLKDSNSNWSIVRTIIVYGTANNLSRTNLVLWALEALPKQSEMKLVNDQFRAPTWADDLAYACNEIVERNERGIFHISGPQLLGINEIVIRIANHLGLGTDKITTISSITLNQPAMRPPKTGFDLSKAAQKLDYKPKTIEESIDLLTKELEAK